MAEQDGSRDPFADYDAAYVFGSLSAADRSAYEAHLITCPSCREAVAAIAGLPGLLSLVPPEQVTSPAEQVPPSLLPRLLSAASAQQRRLRTRTAVGGVLLAACVVAALVVVLRSEQRERPVGAGTVSTVTVGPSTVASVPQVPMRVVAATELRATVGVQSVAWGTRLDLRCTYPQVPAGSSGLAGSSGPSGPSGPSDSGSRSEYGGTSYGMVVVPRTGVASVVATWNPVAGKTIRIDGASKLVTSAIARIEVTDEHGTVLLDLLR